MSAVALAELERLAARALVAGDVSEANAAVVAAALVAADADGLASHGVSRVPFYADQTRSGKVDGHATPTVETTAAAAVVVDAHDGFAFPAIGAGIGRALEIIGDTGVVGVVVTNSHHSGAGGHHVERAAERGVLALGFSNTPAGIAPWGGARGIFGTNPIAFACPRREAPPLVIDLSLSKVARGKVMLAHKRGEPIPPGWALDERGEPTTDAAAALSGTMVPIGDAKGAALALMVELLTAGLAGAHFGYEASSFFTAEGAPPRVAQSFVLLDPRAFSRDAFLDRVESLLEAIRAQPDTRLPGERRLAARARACEHGVEVPDELLEELQRRAGAKG